MAATKWILTDWTLADWTDETNTPFIFFLWEALKLASDERQAFIEQVFNTSFDADNEFPSFGPTGITLSGPDTPNNIVKIVNALNNTAGTKFDFVKTDTIAADGTTVSNSIRADYLDLGDILTDVLSYADDELLIALDTNSGSGVGKSTAIWQMAWLKQMYQVMNYPQYYARQIINTTDSFFSVIQTQRMSLTVNYFPNISLGTATANAMYTNDPNAPTDLYVANDLNETAPFSTPQDVWDYTESTYDGQIAGADWVTTTDFVNGLMDTGARMSVTLSGLGTMAEKLDYASTINQRFRVRFKVTDNKRAVSPSTYVAVLKYYFFLTDGGDTFSDFGIGLNERESKLLTLTPDGNDYYYLEMPTAPDFTTFTVPTVPVANGENENVESNAQFSLNEFTNVTTPALGTRRTDVLIEPNNSDGTSFEYYTP